MLAKALPIHVAAVGLAILALSMPLAAQSAKSMVLPDAPSAVLARRAGDSHPSAAPYWVAWEPTSSELPVAAAQEHLYRPQRQPAAPGFSARFSQDRPIPGAAPALRGPCPNDACSKAERVMCCGRAPSPFARYLKNPYVVPLTAEDNLHSAIKGVIDPFNLLTIGADAAITVASDSHSPYGPGMKGFGKIAGVSLTEDMTGEFFGTFFIPSLVHQDPHYHRAPYLSTKRRILHAVVQVVWSQSYTGRPMFNFGNIVGGIATAVVSNTFVPGPNRQGFSSTAQRLALAFAISPTSNMVEEFLPDVANRINLRVVVFQRILNWVTLEESGVR